MEIKIEADELGGKKYNSWGN